MKRGGFAKVKKVKKPVEKPIKKIVSNEVRTDVDRVVDLVGASPKDKLSLRKIKKRLGLPFEVVEKWAKILDENNVLELVYPKNPFIGAFLRVKKAEYVKAKKHDSKVLKRKLEGKGVGKKKGEKLEDGSGSNKKESGERVIGKSGIGSGEKNSAKKRVAATKKRKTRRGRKTK